MSRATKAKKHLKMPKKAGKSGGSKMTSVAREKHSNSDQEELWKQKQKIEEIRESITKSILKNPAKAKKAAAILSRWLVSKKK